LNDGRDRKDISQEKERTFHLNVKIDHEIRVKVEKDLENVFTDQSGLF